MNPIATRTPAIAGGRPVRDRFLPFVVTRVSEEAIREVVDTLRSGWLASGPKTRDFEDRFAEYVGQRHAVGVSSGTAALALSLEVAEVGPGCEVITSPLTYVATAHEILHRRATPVFADIDRHTFNLDPQQVEQRITKKTRAILLVHFAGRPCDMDRFHALAERHHLVLVSDSAHAIESRYDNDRLARRSALNAFSFHPIKNLTTGEGGMVTTDNPEWASRMRLLRLHGVCRDAWERHGDRDMSPVDVTALGYKCDMSDVQASLGLHHLKQLEQNLETRERLSSIYDQAFGEIGEIDVQAPVRPSDRHARHLYPVVVDTDRLRMSGARFRTALRAENVGSGHHYPAVHRTTFYRGLLGLPETELPNSTEVSERIVSLPLHPSMDEADVRSVIEAVERIVEYHR